MLSHNHEDAQTLITAVKQEALSVGLQINGLKMECMLVGNFKIDSGLTVVEGPIAQVNGFKYQGSWVISQPVSERLHSKGLKFGSSNSACMNSYAPKPVSQMVMSEPKVKGMGAKRTYPNTILRVCEMQCMMRTAGDLPFRCN